ncbi:MAG: alternative ribosome rescue aminoacyl-tRNA hydrolase ArfB [Gammaproteobacteria bacterium]|nr:alternative ribosome rescue aminoacyl-tRNA hydrolase ArfB [Gammaproteobacteria bacterium]
MSPLAISTHVTITDEEIEIHAIRSQGAGGQNVNKVATAIHLRFAITGSSLPEFYKQRLLALKDRRISSEGVIVLKAQRFRTQEKNREDALARLRELIRGVAVSQKKRIATKPTHGSQQRRMDSKTRQSRQKALRGKVI